MNHTLPWLGVKYRRAEGKLPGGTVISFDGRSGRTRRGNLADLLVDLVDQYNSNVPIALRITTLESATVEAARVLRAMADELEGEQR